METFVTDKALQVHELLRKRRSPRAFRDTPVETEKLAGLFEAARWSASSNNEQPWRYIYASADNPEAYARLLSCLVESNQRWAKKAPVLLLSVAKRTFSLNGNPNKYAYHDVGAANAGMAYQAAAAGLQIHQMGGFSADRARQILEIPEDYEPVSMIAVGYPGDADELPEDLRQRELAPRKRRPLAELVFEGKWKQA